LAKGINKKRKKKSKKVKPLLEVLKATRYAGAIFTIEIGLHKNELSIEDRSLEN